jgi:tyrosyl-tRNA synthetase
LFLLQGRIIIKFMNLDTKALLERNVAEIIEKEHLQAVLRSGKKLRIKFGADPTAPDLHLGTAVALRKLKEFQNAGHKVVFIIGDFTAKIGDPTGRSQSRPMLSEKEIKANAKTYFQQAGKILNVKKAEIRYNSEWFNKKKLADLILLAGKFSLNRILERNDFEKRLKSNTEIFSHEILYPMLQAYDSVEIKADVEIGGTDQKFNMLAGRDLQRHLGLPQQDVITLPLLVGLDGVKKMSKSYGNYIGITEAPNAMFGKIMSIPDALIDQYYELCTDEKREISDPREAKLELGKIIVGLYHGAKAGEKAKQEFIRVFSKHEMPSETQSLKLKAKSLSLVELLIKAKMAASKSEARRLIEQGGVKINNEKQTDPNKIIKIEKEALLQVGKHRFLKLT